jgi:hypothetical protein
MLAQMGAKGVSGEMKNLIFAADGTKAKIVLRDAVDNVIEIVENGQYCLVYDRPLGEHGLSWQELVNWWIGTRHPATTASMPWGSASNCSAVPPPAKPPLPGSKEMAIPSA